MLKKNKKRLGMLTNYYEFCETNSKYLKMKLKFNGLLVLLVVLIAQITFAQERAVSGTVSDNAGMPLPVRRRGACGWQARSADPRARCVRASVRQASIP